MRKTRIKSVYHWFIMSLVMGMPLLLTLLSSIPNAYNENNVVYYESTEYEDVTNIEYNKVYYMSLNGKVDSNNGDIWFGSIQNLVVTSYDSYSVYDNPNANGIINNASNTYLYVGSELKYYVNPVCVFDFTFGWTDTTYNPLLPNVKIKNEVKKYVINNSAYQVWQFNQKFMSLPINSWYHDLMEMTIGVPSDYSPMNNMVVFPLYGVWVLLFDLVFDCLAFIPNVCHNWLEKLGGDKE